MRLHIKCINSFTGYFVFFARRVGSLLDSLPSSLRLLLLLGAIFSVSAVAEVNNV